MVNVSETVNKFRVFTGKKLDNGHKPCIAGFYTEHRFRGLLVSLADLTVLKTQETN